MKEIIYIGVIGCISCFAHGKQKIVSALESGDFLIVYVMKYKPDKLDFVELVLKNYSKSKTDYADFHDITTSTDIMDFYLPVRNTPAVPVDYNIYRNHEYKFSVHALEQWTSAASGAVSGTRNSVTELLKSSMVLRMNNR